MGAATVRSVMCKTARWGGFTLTELVIVLVVLGILAAFAVARVVDRQGFDARGFADEVSSTLRFARQQAIAQRRQVCVTFGVAGNLTLTQAAVFGGACVQNLTNPATGAAYNLPAPNGVAVTMTLNGAAQALPAVIAFDANGVPAAGATVTVTGDVAHLITVEANTGYVH